MPDPRELAGDETEASRAEVEFQRVTNIARARLGPHQLIAQRDQVADEFTVH